jgi:hypothetical protein
LRDFTGMLGSILFTLHQGSNLDSSAKQWRLAADLLNDVGMLMDLLSPLFPGAFVTILCIGSMARSVTGVASGATRAALTQHFASRKNAADVSAKSGDCCNHGWNAIRHGPSTLNSRKCGCSLGFLPPPPNGFPYVCKLQSSSVALFGELEC